MLDIQIKPKDVAAKSALRNLYIEKYAKNVAEYRRRKTGERPFWNAENIKSFKYSSVYTE